MKQSNKIWRILAILSIVVLLANLIIHTFDLYLLTFEFGFLDFFGQLFWKNIIPIICILPTLFIGLILCKIDYLKIRYNINFKKGVIIATLFIYSLTMIAPVRLAIQNRKIKVLTDNSIKIDLIQYETSSATMFFKKSDVINYCENTLRYYQDSRVLDSIKLYFENSDSNLVINSEYIFLPDTFDLIESYENDSSFDTVYFIDRSNITNSFIELMYYASTELIKKVGFRLYDKENKEFVDYIYYQTISSDLGNVDFCCYLPNGRIFLYVRLMWGL